MTELSTPISTVIGVIAEKNAVLVRAQVTITETISGGSSPARTVSHQEVWTVPARVLNRGSLGVRDYFNYEVGDVVYLLSGTMGAEPGEWAEEMATVQDFHAVPFYVAGAFYTGAHEPPSQYNKIRMVDFGNGNYISIDIEQNSIDIHFKGAVYINGEEIYLNG